MVKPRSWPADQPSMEQFAATPAPMPLGRPIRRRLGRRLLALVALALAGLWLGLHEDVKQYRVASGSMEPTLAVGERVTAEASSTPQVGDIVVFHPPVGARPKDPVCGVSDQGPGSTQACGAPVARESSDIFVKRVVAGPGDAISIVDGHAVVNGVKTNEPYAAPCGASGACSFPTPVTVPPGEYYVLGDNRGVSDDSRFWGPVPKDWIIGTVVRCSLLDTMCHAVH
jgi:signal peptidase I